jgi:hypothetical protein
MVYEDWLSPKAESPKVESRSSLCHDICQSGMLRGLAMGHGTHVDFERRAGAASFISGGVVVPWHVGILVSV